MIKKCILQQSNIIFENQYINIRLTIAVKKNNKSKNFIS